MKLPSAHEDDCSMIPWSQGASCHALSVIPQPLSTFINLLTATPTAQSSMEGDKKTVQELEAENARSVPCFARAVPRIP